MLTHTFETAATYRIKLRYPLPADREAEAVIRLLWERTDIPMIIPVLTSDQPVFAVVNHGRWIARCDNPGCHGAALVSKTDHRFFCMTCFNEAQGTLWRPVVWPADVDGIEAALRPRLTVNANTEPLQTAAELLAENEAMNQ